MSAYLWLLALPTVIYGAFALGVGYLPKKGKR